MKPPFIPPSELVTETENKLKKENSCHGKGFKVARLYPYMKKRVEEML